MNREKLERTISEAYRDRERLEDRDVADAVEAAIELLDRGQARVAEKVDGQWRVNAWLKEAILLYFALRPLEPIEAGDLRFFDKIRTKRGLRKQGIRVVPPGVARYGSHLEPGCVLMPGYVNIGAYVGAGTMVGELVNGEIREYEIHPEDFGLQMIASRNLQVANAEESKAKVLEALSGEPGAAHDIVALNAGTALYASGVAVSIEDGLAKARAAIASGAARTKLAQFVRVTRQLAGVSPL